MSQRPKCSSTVSASRLHSSHLPTWVPTASVRRPVLSAISSATASQLSSLRLAMTTSAPCSAKATAIALPMPRLPPVMTATLSVRSGPSIGIPSRAVTVRLNAMQEELCSQQQWDLSDLSAVFINCTLKRSPEVSNTQGLIDISAEIMRRQGVTVKKLRAVDHDIATGVWPDMTEHGWEHDEWPAIFEQVMAAQILVLATPIWLGEKSSVCTHVIERLYGNSSQLNDAGQYAYYGRVGGCLVTGNEDGIKHCSMNVLYSLQHLGYVIPPQADAGWIGEAGPGPSYLDPGSGGPENDFTNRNTTFMTWNLLHLARMITDAGGIPAHGNQRSEVGRRLPLRLPQPRAPLMHSGESFRGSHVAPRGRASHPTRHTRSGVRR